MKETQVRNHIRDTLKRYGFRVRVVTDGIKCPRCHSVIVPQSGRPDLKAVRPHADPCYVEVKVVHSHEKVFDLGAISDVQREGLTERADEGYAVYIGLGIIRRHGRLDRLDNIYLVEWRAWLAIEAEVTLHQNTIPLVAGKGYLRALQEGGLDIVTKFKRWELRKAQKGWAIPPHHPAYTTLNLNNGERRNETE